jgi:predicted RNA methylase
MLRKLRNLVASRGVLGTLEVVRAAVVQRVRGQLRRVSPEARANAARDVAFDQSVGIDTHGKVPFAKLDVRDQDLAQLVAYQPSPPETVLTLIDRAKLDCERFAFVDLGAGKGRPCFVAARRPFRKIVGVEFSSDLCEAARANLAALRDPERRCSDIAFACQDATTFELPSGPCVIYMYNPFGAEPMGRLVAHLERSLAAQPRELWVLYYNAACRQLFDKSAAFTLLDGGEPMPNVPDPWAIYRSSH